MLATTILSILLGCQSELDNKEAATVSDAPAAAPAPAPAPAPASALLLLRGSVEPGGRCLDPLVRGAAGSNMRCGSLERLALTT